MAAAPAPRRGLHGLFLAAIGLALVLRQVLLLVAGPVSALVRRRPVQGVRARRRAPLRWAGRRDRPRRRAIVLVGLLLGLDVIGRTDARRWPTIARSRPSRGNSTRGGRLTTWSSSGLPRGARRRADGTRAVHFDPELRFLALLLPVFAAVVLGGIGSAYGALAGGSCSDRDRALHLGGFRGRGRSGLQAGGRVRPC